MSPDVLPQAPYKTFLGDSWLGGRTGGPLGEPILESELEALGKVWEANVTFQEMNSHLESTYLSNSENYLTFFRSPPLTVIHLEVQTTDLG